MQYAKQMRLTIANAATWASREFAKRGCLKCNKVSINRGLYFANQVDHTTCDAANQHTGLLTWEEKFLARSSGENKTLPLLGNACDRRACTLICWKVCPKLHSIHSLTQVCEIQFF